MFSYQNRAGTTATTVNIISNARMDSSRNGASSSTASSTATTTTAAAHEVPEVEQTLASLKDLMLNPMRAPPPSNKLKIVTRSAVERFNLTVEEPVGFQWLENYYKVRHAGMEFKIYHANNTFDFLQQITSQKDLDEAIRLHKLRSKDSKFRLSIVPKIEGNNANEVLMRPDPRGIFHGINYEDAYSETGTSAFTVAMGPIRQRLQEVLSRTTEIPQPPTDWREGVCIGQGAHGRVLLCIDKDTHEQLVVKKIFAKGEVSSMRRRMFNLAEEISMLSKLSHENIVKYRGVIISDNCVNIFMEYMTAGSLYDEINKKGFGAVSPKGTVETTKQILRGLEYLHDLEIVHRDIKSANILRHAYPVVFKIGDFGSAQYYRALASLNSIDYLSTPHYTAPELVKSNNPYDEKADIWSMGIVMIEMLTKKPPYSEIEPNAVLFKIAEGPIKYKLPDDCPPPLANVISIMLNVNPRQRPSARELLQMDIFS
uniref:Protein kinase domain-containing protein n=1 Tax=Panagrolaimus sp. PS1159 TaxID=55785 RepID=A0AC35EYL5_9BILA